MVTCSRRKSITIFVVCLLIIPAFIFWIWLMKEAIWASSQCPDKCWCGAGDTTVDCTNASLQDIPQYLHSKIHHLILSHNNITILRTNHFLNSGLVELEILTMKSNGMHTIEPGAFRGLPKLEHLHLQGNNITTFKTGAFNNLPNLRGLHLARNNIRKIPPGIFRDLNNLLYISIEGNEIEDLEADIFIGLTNLRNLWLSDNKLTHIDPEVFKHMPNLTLISLENNKRLVVPTDKPFLNVPTLKTYLLSGCNITSISAKTFEKSPNLTRVNLADNNLVTLDMDILRSLPKMKDITLHGNPLDCDCRLLDVWQWSKKYDITVLHIEDKEVRCNSPQEVSGFWWGVLSKANCLNGHIVFQDDYKSIVPEYTSYYPEYERHLKFMTYVESSVYGVLFLIGATGNIIILIIIGCNRRMRTIPNAYIFNLAVGDLLSLTMNLPLSHAMEIAPNWLLGEFMCKLTFFSRELSIGVAGFSVAVLSTQRYFATSGSVNLSTKRATIISIAAVWFTAGCCALPSAFSVHVEEGKWCSPFYSMNYYTLAVTFQLLVFCIIPLCVIVFMYVMTARHLVCRAQKFEEESRSYRTLAKIVIGLSIVFFFSFVPYHVLWTILVWYDTHFQPIIGYLIFVSLCLLVLNSCLNPIVLCYTSVTFRKLFKYYLFCCRHPSTQNEEESDFLEGKEGVVHYKRDVVTEAVVL